MTVSSGSVIIKKDDSNLIGISIGGGAPYCPCLYIVQVIPAIIKKITVSSILLPIVGNNALIFNRKNSSLLHP